ncbi:hypothetical protein Desdi_1628 [Desulfitobacterium dichloroeliminans LMG P-21439]|uniref:Uncharacterized protein n=1 Tax=Desulfitobacterium dichloroeliminans (strain LMG P-21439 / DCA1) TaxID=871963 RepID=L0F850_DESDL|nr:hypothetical protein [Desulfitobacterium dichloroeliminans]AGA69118.1 hypothetical protein Desdi_1628 [Desulfitobacterium dichloroeliminans LMG P-21439]
MDKRILESVKEFYRNVKNQEFASDLFSYQGNSDDDQERKPNYYEI